MQVIGVNWILGLIIGIDAGTEDTDKLLNAGSVRLSDHIPIHRQIVLEKAHLIVHIGK